MVTITLARVQSKGDAEKFAKRINGTTYMNFQVNVAPDYGQFAVSVDADADTKEDAIEMLLALMFDKLSA